MYMKKTFLIIGILVLSCFSVFSQKGDEDPEMSKLIAEVKNRDKDALDKAKNGWWKESMKTRDQRLEWWKEAKFGMFIHWGVYSVAGGEWKGHRVNTYAEHLMRKERISRAEYLELAHQFNPIGFNADEWISTAKQAGMKYFVITAKHHDGFAIYDSKVSDFTIIKQSPFKRDPIAELAAACKKQGMKFGFYYSHAFDWEHPLAPGNDWEYKNPGGDSLLFGGSRWYDVRPDLLPNAVKYVDEKAIPQIKELLRNYHPDILWFDTPHKLPTSENLRILQAIRETDPNVVVNGRIASSSFVLGDYLNTGDRPAEFAPVKGDWEGIPTTNESYGYSKLDNSHKTVPFFIQLLSKAAAKGGNLLMNIGPMGNGKFDQKDTKILRGIGNWMAVNGESIYGTKRSPLAIQNWGVCTQKADKLYLHVFNWPSDGKLMVGGLKSEVKKAYLLADKTKKALKIKRTNPLDLSLQLPLNAPDSVSSIVVLETVVPVVADSVRLLSPLSPNRLLAFDAQLIGNGFSFADGKTNNFIVQNWTQNSQKVSWNLRLNQPMAFKVTLKYVANTNCEGEFKLTANQKSSLNAIIKPEKKNGEVITLPVGTLELQSGTTEIGIEPVKIAKNELMKLLEITLTPVVR